ncbi:MAG: cysteine--tRNA ligase [Gammaproteobacteria bacterium]|nr:cysteine--tRNA ligase [Gammaproteobacteria bacterium]MBU1629022.1 cysteine--tRNA ligase [Gammaproteobacteria bacterium]MBU1926301.1 cysteine--tRNA ligase [Gammaproteobacteria bacterium]MBU2545622.1 cysteine--tRNA ligase [Gammaproteobacteria bacterium]
MLHIYNSLTGKKEAFKPIHEGKVNLYVCGMTVYDYCHIGHARAMIAFDVVVRYLRFLNYQVKYVRNITDIDDKIIKRANENKEDFRVLADRYIQAMHEDFDALGLLHPDLEPRATEFIQQMFELIEQLIGKGIAYIGKNGDVLYSVKKFEKYGCLSHRKLDQLRAGARIEVSENKKDPLDFVLWKSAKPGEPSWESPFGNGRPGWHIECSAMAMNCLANRIDIHGGGKDLIFPHHENEIAQTEAATDAQFANYWMHAGHLEINKQKMSKSLGNFFTIRDVLKKYHPEVIRFFMISSHYRSPLNYSAQALIEAEQSLSRLYLTLRSGVANEDIKETVYEADFVAAMDDDFNTPKALAVLFELSKEVNRLRDADQVQSLKYAALLKRLGQVLGLFAYEPEQFLQHQVTEEDNDVQTINAFIEERNKARQEKDWGRADAIRTQLDEMGVVIEDGGKETTWRRK